MARRALLLIDGLDEGGPATREALARHLVEVVAPQGHLLLVSSRPESVDEASFADFHRLSLAPLGEASQHEYVARRLGLLASDTAAAAHELLGWLPRMPLDPTTGQRVTREPVLLSMIVGEAAASEPGGTPEGRGLSEA